MCSTECGAEKLPFHQDINSERASKSDVIMITNHQIVHQSVHIREYKSNKVVLDKPNRTERRDKPV